MMSDDLPGMWEPADMSGGWADVTDERSRMTSDGAYPPKGRVRWWVMGLRQLLCSHDNTYEEWQEIGRGLLMVTNLRTLWRCKRCGKEIRRSRNRASNKDTPATPPSPQDRVQFGRHFSHTGDQG